MTACRWDPERNVLEFEQLHGFRPQDVAFEPALHGGDRRDQRDPSRLGGKILSKLAKHPKWSVLRAADKVVGSPC